MIQAEVKRAKQNKRQTRAVETGTQGALTTRNKLYVKFTWATYGSMTPSDIPISLSQSMTSYHHPQMSFATHTRFKMQILNVISCCPTALSQGRYRCCHDNVLIEVVDWLE
ncbi:hypothetical protein DPMN_009007 [Dreissena polymorpha]|uniref:Uncharacterized protein n=1 Tax=Dreissena polymorpha TaxID=45954 RepID=A0A9D4MX98_DREPO|nr:hypothetical protein DPMN_009007 [Dreissena polymorpha]